jgi:hypothetical protein
MILSENRHPLFGIMLYPAHSGGRTCDGQDARFCGAAGDKAWIEVASRGEVPAGGMKSNRAE